MNSQLNNKKTKIMSRDNNRFSKTKMMIALLVLAISSFLIPQNTYAQAGEQLFKANCGMCHWPDSRKLTGPGLEGVTEKRSEEWLISWVKDANALANSGDADAKALVAEYGYPMPPVVLSDEEIMSIFAYVDEKNAAGADIAEGGGGTTVESSTPQEVFPMSGIEKDIIFWAIILALILIFYVYRYYIRSKEKFNQMGIHEDAHSVKNFPAIFMVMALVAIGVIYTLTNSLQNDVAQINNLMFVALPYVAFAIFIVGTIYRYTKKGYQVSSLSSQFIEGKKLFWGSQPFHWGILVLFVGHLIAFLFPSALLAWNGQTIRLLILEISSFAFALSALLGLILLIKRRLSTKTLLVVTNKMDMLVYVVLLTQIISGIGVAFFVRWGSGWFASVLTPYLRSVFSFDPDIAAVSVAPVWIQIHIISAFLIIAIIPFTRFMHFLVAPIDYIWRRYQLVLWNWDKKEIRKSTRHFFGKRSRNH